MKLRKFSKKIVALVVILNMLFSAAVLFIFYRTNEEPAVIISAWFAFTTGELWMLSDIKKSEIRKKEDKKHDV